MLRVNKLATLTVPWGIECLWYRGFLKTQPAGVKASASLPRVIYINQVVSMNISRLTALWIF